MRTIYVTRIYQVNLPDDRTAIDDAIAADNLSEDTKIIQDSDTATAVFLSYQYDGGNFTDIVQIFDVAAGDAPADVEEFENFEG